MYVYVSNNPISNTDDDGNFFEKVASKIKKMGKSVKDFFNNISKKVSSNNKKSKTSTNSGNRNKLPVKGKPISTQTNPNGDIRVYGPNGRALKDIDKSHPQHHPDLLNPHVHDWDWGNDTPKRGPARNPQENERIVESVAIGVGTVGVGYLVYRGIRMLPSLIPGLWWTMPLNFATP